MFRSSKLAVSNWFDLFVVCFSLLGVVVGHQLMELGGGAGRGLDVSNRVLQNSSPPLAPSADIFCMCCENMCRTI